MARAATSTDVFNAIAEERRREIITVLRSGEAQTVGDIAGKLGMLQPSVSKHLGVLRKVGVVTMIKNGRHRMYRLDGRKLKPVHDWLAKYESFWSAQIKNVKERAEKMVKEENN
jgi:DNA-binding transcriptional ArsR family regulator